MIRKLVILVNLLFFSMTVPAQSLKESIGRYCLIGTAVNQAQSGGFDSRATDVIRKHFNSIVAENCMKSEVIQPAEGIFMFKEADTFMKYAEDNHLTAIGHCLIWHSQAPKWFFTATHSDGPASREEMIERIKTHVATVVGRYRGRVHGWDVVNEAIDDNGEFRQSPFYKIVGPEYIDIAFKAAHEADPDAELYYNDYSMSNPKRRAGVCQLIRHLKSIGCRIDAVGMQSHNGMDYPNLKEYETSIDSFAACGVKVMMTELDLNALPSPEKFSGAGVEQNFEYQKKLNPYANGLPADKAQQIEQRYLDFFKIYYRHRSQISRITLWGIFDHDSWLNNWPVKGRTNFPLLFDRNFQEKPIVKDIINLYK